MSYAMFQKFLIEANGVLEPINLSFRTGSKLNAELEEYAPVTIPNKKGVEKLKKRL